MINVTTTVITDSAFSLKGLLFRRSFQIRLTAPKVVQRIFGDCWCKIFYRPLPFLSQNQECKSTVIWLLDHMSSSYTLLDAVFFCFHYLYTAKPAILRHCWLDSSKCIRPVKKSECWYADGDDLTGTKCRWSTHVSEFYCHQCHFRHLLLQYNQEWFWHSRTVLPTSSPWLSWNTSC